MAKTVIRYATSADLPVLLEIDESAFPAGVAYDSAELSYFMSRPAARTLILETDGSIAAFLIVDIDRRRKTATLVTLDVRGAHRRSGYGSRLLGRSEELLEADGVDAYVLQVDVENHGAIAFYKRHGFQQVRVLRKYYPDGHDAFLMVKKLRTGGGV